MFPGYVTTYRDKNKQVHLYFFPGIDYSDNKFYYDLNLNCSTKYEVICHSDDAKEYVFENKNIIRIVCKLLDNKGVVHEKELIC